MSDQREITRRPSPSDGRLRFQRTRLAALAMTCAVAVIGASGAENVAGSDQTTASSDGTPTPVAFQPGVRIDWAQKRVLVDTTVALQRGMLEFVACFPGKEHESVVLCHASAMHVFMAMGLVGLTPGRPPTWNDERGAYDPPEGDPVDIAFEWTEDDRQRAVDAYEWVVQLADVRPPVPRPWVFAGSVLLDDGALSSDYSGVGVAVVDKPDSLIAYPRSFPSRLDSLWLASNAKRVPPTGTPVTMVITAAKPRRYDVALDFRGDIRVNGRVTSEADLADIIAGARRVTPNACVEISDQEALSADIAALEATLRRLGTPAGAWRVTTAGAATQTEPEGGAEPRPVTDSRPSGRSDAD